MSRMAFRLSNFVVGGTPSLVRACFVIKARSGNIVGKRGLIGRRRDGRLRVQRVGFCGCALCQGGKRQRGHQADGDGFSLCHVISQNRWYGCAKAQTIYPMHAARGQHVSGQHRIKRLSGNASGGTFRAVRDEAGDRWCGCDDDRLGAAESGEGIERRRGRNGANAEIGTATAGRVTGVLRCVGCVSRRGRNRQRDRCVRAIVMVNRGAGMLAMFDECRHRIGHSLLMRGAARHAHGCGTRLKRYQSHQKPEHERLEGAIHIRKV